MKYFPLIVSGLWRKPIRTVLTVLAIVVAYVLFGVMQGVVSGFDTALDQMSDTRLRIMSRANMLEPLPLAHGARIERVPGVTRVAYVSILGFYYQDVTNGVSAAALDMDAFLDVIPMIKVPEDQREQLMRTRTGALVGYDLAQQYGWKIGDRVPFQSFIWLNEEGGRDWTVDIVAIANAGPDDEKLFASELYIHYDFFDETRAEGKGTVHQFIAAVDDVAQTDAIAQAIDALFANSSDETTTLNEKQYITAMMSQIGDIGLFVNAVLGAVLFTLLFLTGTTMMQSVRERIPELGVMKSVGFTDTTVLVIVLVEALVLCLVAAGIGLTIAAIAFPPVFQSMGLAAIPLGADVLVLGFAVAVALAGVVAFWPAWRAQRLSIAEALSGR